MAKSKYPNQIDTPSELPVVRDNIFEIGSDAINSLRSAIIQIEKTLGINPQGTVGLTVGERISQSLDSSGNIKREAIDRAGIIFGPIFDDQISDSAAIKESKLKLNFPTNVLQAQISHVSSLIDEIQFQVEQISSKLSAHLSPEAANRHPATAISTTVIEPTSSSSGLKSSSASNVQSVLDSIFSSHINYDGSLISEINNSHTAEQIYFNNANTPDITSANVQNAIEDVASFLQQEVVEHQNLLHSAGSSRSSKIRDISEIDYGTIFISAVSLTVDKNLGEKPYFEVTLDSPTPVLPDEIKIGDIVELTVNSIKKEYQIYKTNYDSLKENIVGFLLFGVFPTNEIGISAKVFSRRLKSQSNFGIISSARENIGLSSSSIIQIINLDAPYIESTGINPNEISITNRYFDLKINGINYSFDIYNSAIITQSIDSIIKAINETVDYLGLSILAFRVDKENKRSEIVIAHNVSSDDLATASLEIVRVDGSIDSLGLSSYESIVVYGRPGSSHYISGKKYTGLLKKFDLAGFDIQSGSRNINSGALGINFLDYNLKKGDIVNIIDSFYNSYEITDVTSSYISVSARQLPAGFTSEAVGTARIIVYESSVDVSSFEFSKIGIESSPTSGSSLFEIFLDQNRYLNASLILEQQSEIYLNKSIYQVLSFNSPEDVESIQINFENTEDLCVNVWLDNYSEKKKIVGDFNYIKLRSNLNNFECLIFIPTASGLHNYAAGVGDSFSKIIYLNNKINRENNLIISNIHYSNQLGRFDGGINGSLFVSGLNFGNLDEKDISTKFKEILTELPISELRSSGFVHGLKITAVTDPDGYTTGNYFVSIESGICYVDGKRFLISEINDYNTAIDAAVYDKVYVGIDRYGNFVFSGPDPSCAYPWAEETILLVGTIENTGTTYNIIDQRLFINNLDLKLLNSITVSPQPGMGHFSSFVEAIKYAKRFSEIFPKAGTPEIHLKSGKHTISTNITTTSTFSTWSSNIISSTVNSDKTSFYNVLIQSGLIIDFPLSISGEGDGTDLELSMTIAASDYTNSSASGYLLIPGKGFNSSGTESTIPHGRFYSGAITIKNLKISNGTILLADLNINDGVNLLNFYVNLNQINFSSGIIRLIEASDSTNYKGNVVVSGCKLQAGIIHSPYTTAVANRLKNISILNNISPTTTFNLGNVGSNSTYLAENNIVFLGNISGSPTTSYRKDRVAYDLFVPHDLSVANNLSVTGNATHSGNILFSSSKKLIKTYWLYQNQIVTDPGSTSTVFNATDAMGYTTGGPWSSSVRVSLASGGNYYYPKVRVNTGEYVSTPIDISIGQKLTKVIINGGLSPSNQISYKIISRAVVGVIATSTEEYSSPIITRNSNFTFVDTISFKPTTEYRVYSIVIKNETSSSYDEYTCVYLEFESNNLFELIGIS